MFKETFFTLKEFPWIPGPGGINLTKGVGSATGQLIESSSPLGILLQPSFLQPLFNHMNDRKKYDMVLDKINNEMRKPMRRSAYD